MTKNSMIEIKKGKKLAIERAKEITIPLLINNMPLPALPENKQPGELK